MGGGVQNSAVGHGKSHKFHHLVARRILQYSSIAVFFSQSHEKKNMSFSSKLWGKNPEIRQLVVGKYLKIHQSVMRKNQFFSPSWGKKKSSNLSIIRSKKIPKFVSQSWWNIIKFINWYQGKNCKHSLSDHWKEPQICQSVTGKFCKIHQLVMWKIRKFVSCFVFCPLINWLIWIFFLFLFWFKKYSSKI